MQGACFIRSGRTGDAQASSDGCTMAEDQASPSIRSTLIPRADGAVFPTVWPCRKFCSFREPGQHGNCYHRNWVAAVACPAGGAFGIGRLPVSGKRFGRHSLMSWGWRTRSTGPRPWWIAVPSGLFLGGANWPQSHGSRQKRVEKACHQRRPRRPTRVDPYRRECSRFPSRHALGRFHSFHQEAGVRQETHASGI